MRAVPPLNHLRAWQPMRWCCSPFPADGKTSAAEFSICLGSSPFRASLERPGSAGWGIPLCRHGRWTHRSGCSCCRHTAHWPAMLLLLQQQWQQLPVAKCTGPPSPYFSLLWYELACKRRLRLPLLPAAYAGHTSLSLFFPWRFAALDKALKTLIDGIPEKARSKGEAAGRAAALALYKKRWAPKLGGGLPEPGWPCCACCAGAGAARPCSQAAANVLAAGQVFRVKSKETKRSCMSQTQAQVFTRSPSSRPSPQHRRWLCRLRALHPRAPRQRPGPLPVHPRPGWPGMELRATLQAHRGLHPHSWQGCIARFRPPRAQHAQLLSLARYPPSRRPTSFTPRSPTPVPWCWTTLNR